MKKTMTAISILCLVACPLCLAEATGVGTEQGPGIDAFTGVWVSYRAVLTVEASGDGASCSIHWGNSAFDATEWAYGHCVYDAAINGLRCDGDGVKAIREYAEGGEVASEEILYTDGAAEFALREDGALVWTDLKEGGDAVVFERTEDTADMPGAQDAQEMIEEP